ncbi:MAG: hypothetical protein ABIP08_10980 [Lautropia sp.]
MKIPAKSPSFDPSWSAHGEFDAVITAGHAWCARQPIKDLKLEIVCLPGKTPFLYSDRLLDNDSSVLFYGHLDKQPEMGAGART